MARIEFGPWTSFVYFAYFILSSLRVMSCLNICCMLIFVIFSFVLKCFIKCCVMSYRVTFSMLMFVHVKYRFIIINRVVQLNVFCIVFVS